VSRAGWNLTRPGGVLLEVRRVAALVLCGLLLIGCRSGALLAGTAPALTPEPSPAEPATPLATTDAMPPPELLPGGARQIPGGCGATQVYQGATPTWLEAAAGHNAPHGLPFVVADPPLAAGFLFGAPLRAGHPTNPTNKVLWVVRTPRAGLPLQIEGQPLGATTPTVHLTEPANSGPGEIYPSIVDVPSAGCWQFTLGWGSARATVQLLYEPT